MSLYHTRYCSAGAGTVAYVDISGEHGLQGLFTDNEEVAAFIKNWNKGRGGIYDRDLPVVNAQFHRKGDIRTAPYWFIQSSTDEVVALWEKIQPPIVAEGPAPTFNANTDIFTVLFFADEASITVNGWLGSGKPYMRDIWKKSIGGERSSCVFALAETMTDLI